MGKKYYAVRKGRQPGLYIKWAECKLQVLDYPECEYQSFTRKSLAEAYLAEAIAEEPVLQIIPDVEIVYQLEYDGASKGNPGKAGAGAILRQPDGAVVQELMIGLGEETSNYAEYCGLILGLKAALARKMRRIQVQGDSNLICMQVAGKWAVRSEKLLPLHAEAQELVKQFSEFSIRHVRRELNAAADALANKGVHLKFLEVSDTALDITRDDKTSIETQSVTPSVDLIIKETTKKKKPRERSAEEDLVYRLEYDGASKGNPGKAGAGALLRNPAGSVVEELTIGLGITTNNVAEYEGLILGLQAALNRSINRIQVQGDSNLVCKQVQGEWTVRNEKLKPLHARARALVKQFREFSIRHVKRELNAAADELANKAVRAHCLEQDALETRLNVGSSKIMDHQAPTVSLQRQLEVDLKNIPVEMPTTANTAKTKLAISDEEVTEASRVTPDEISSSIDLGKQKSRRKTKAATSEEDLVYQVEYDGASKGNPGRAGAGALLRHPNGSVIHQVTMGLGFTTNNVAEYRALILGLEAALDKKITRIQVLGDSSLVCNQVAGEWAVKNQTLRPLHAQAQALAKQFARFSIHHVERDFNASADALANRAATLKWNEVKTKPARKSDVCIDNNAEMALEPPKRTGKMKADSTGSGLSLLASRHKLPDGIKNLQAACSFYRRLHCSRIGIRGTSSIFTSRARLPRVVAAVIN